MRRDYGNPACVVLAALTCAVATMCSSPTARAGDEDRSASRLIREGNDALDRGEHAAALRKYDEASQAMPGSAEPAYNRGVALYRLGKYDEAEKAFQDALATDDPKLGSKARFNLGRSAHAEALARVDEPDAAIDAVLRAIRFYDDAVQQSKEDVDALLNKERAQQLLTYLEKKREQQKQSASQPSSQPSSQPTSKPTSQPQPQPSSQPSSQPTSQPTSQPQPSSQPTSQPSPEQQKEQGDQEGEQQDQQQPQPGDKGDEQEQQKEAGQEGEPQEGERQSDKGQRPGEEQRRELTPEEAERLLQQVRDAERQRREARRQEAMRLRGRTPVKRDW